MSLPRYAEYKPSGYRWLSEIPKHWVLGPLKRMLDIQNGADHKAVEAEDGIPVIGSGGPFTFATDYLYEGESVLLGRKGTIDKPLYFVGHFWTVDTMYWSKILPGTYGKFAYYSALTIPFAYYSTSTALPSMTKGVLGAHLVAIPPIDEQERIATFLDLETAKIDALIAEQEKLISLLAEKRQTIITQAVTHGLHPKAPMRDSGVDWLGVIPKHWKVHRLGALFQEVHDSGWDDLPVLSVSIHDGVSNKELSESEMDRKVTRSEDRSKYKEVRPGDLTYNMMRAWQGGFGAVSVHGMVSPAYVVARPTMDFMTSHIELLLRTPRAVSEMKRHSRGITDFRLRLYWEEFKTIKVAMPPKTEQMEISAIVRAESGKVDALVMEAERSTKLLKERRSALIAAAVTGQIDVRGAVPEPTLHE
jgi:type I restriction enzyme S subunit